MSLVTYLTQVSSDKIPLLKGEWRQFVLDHLAYIARASETYDIAPELMNLYRYDLSRFLRVRLERRQEMTEVVCLLNNMDNDFSFYKPGPYIIPLDDFMAGLYSSFLTTINNQS